jgi:hypothetical protein
MNPNQNQSEMDPGGVLNFFTQTTILRQIGHRRLAKLFSPFAEELKAASLVLPTPDPDDDDYFADLANSLCMADRLPGRLRQTLLTIELAAYPENNQPLRSATHPRIPQVSVSQDCAVDRALDLWFVAPEEFSQFIAPNSHVAAPVKARPSAASQRRLQGGSVRRGSARRSDDLDHQRGRIGIDIEPLLDREKVWLRTAYHDSSGGLPQLRA